MQGGLGEIGLKSMGGKIISCRVLVALQDLNIWPLKLSRVEGLVGLDGTPQ